MIGDARPYPAALTFWVRRKTFIHLTFACGPHHKLLDDGWRTRKDADGITEWIPPPGLDFGKPRTNGYFHPQRYLREDDDAAP